MLILGYFLALVLIGATAPVAWSISVDAGRELIWFFTNITEGQGVVIAGILAGIGISFTLAQNARLQRQVFEHQTRIEAAKHVITFRPQIVEIYGWVNQVRQESSNINILLTSSNSSKRISNSDSQDTVRIPDSTYKSYLVWWTEKFIRKLLENPPYDACESLPLWIKDDFDAILLRAHEIRSGKFPPSPPDEDYFKRDIKFSLRNLIEENKALFKKKLATLDISIKKLIQDLKDLEAKAHVLE